MTKRKIKSVRPMKRAVSVASVSTRSELLNYQEAARFLGISQGTLENWVSTGLYGVPHIKLGRLIRFRPASLSRWLELREHSSGEFLTAPTKPSSEIISP
jgi:excisionase family DNA binding protein